MVRFLLESRTSYKIHVTTNENRDMTKRYICYIKREDRMEEPKTITVTEKELIDLIEEGKEVQGYRMSQIEMITTKEEDNTTCAYSGLPSLTEYQNR
jgi:hypothetical protein